MRSSLSALCALLCLVVGLSAFAQTSSNKISITQLTVQPVMPGDLKQWMDVPNGISLEARTNVGTDGVRSRLLVRIRQGNNIVCGVSPANGMTIAPFSQRVFTGKDLQPALSTCSNISEGSYAICFQFFNEGNEAISPEVCREFKVEKPIAVKSYAPPVNISPADNRLFVPDEARTNPIRFEWKAVSPAPEGTTSYRLRIWQVKAGQSIESAMARNTPVFSKVVAGSTSITLKNELPISNNAANKYVWTVQAMDGQGSPIGSNEGISQPTSFLIADYIIRIKGISVLCTATPGVYSFSYVVENINPATAKLTNLVVTSSVPAGATITSFTPPLNTNIVSGGTLVITGLISASPTLNNICIGAEITDLVNSFWKASRDTCIPVKPCICDFCESNQVKITINPTSSTVDNVNNTLTMTQPITIATTPLKLIKSIEAELVYFEFVPESDNCIPCLSSPSTYGNMSYGSLAGEWGAGTGTHDLQWVYSPPKNFSSTQNAVVTFTYPPTQKCCVTVRWCIRYVIRFADCTVCSKVVCYEKKKVGCPQGDPDHNHN